MQQFRKDTFLFQHDCPWAQSMRNNLKSMVWWNSSEYFWDELKSNTFQIVMERFTKKWRLQLWQSRGGEECVQRKTIYIKVHGFGTDVPQDHVGVTIRDPHSLGHVVQACFTNMYQP